MNVLLDTHALIWFLNGDDKLSQKAKTTILDQNTKSFVSIASFWEIAIKISIGKMDMDMTLDDLETLVISNQFEILPIIVAHTKRISTWPFHHKDPFDRAIISQAVTEQIHLISCDEIFDEYLKGQRVSRIW